MNEYSTDGFKEVICPYAINNVFPDKSLCRTNTCDHSYRKEIPTMGTGFGKIALCTRKGLVPKTETPPIGTDENIFNAKRKTLKKSKGKSLLNQVIDFIKPF